MGGPTLRCGCCSAVPSHSHPCTTHQLSLGSTSPYSPCEAPAWSLGLSAHSAGKQGSLWSLVYFALPICCVQMEQGSSVVFGKDCTHSAICTLLVGSCVAMSCGSWARVPADTPMPHLHTSGKDLPWYPLGVQPFVPSLYTHSDFSLPLSLEWIWGFFKPRVFSAREFMRAIKGRMMIKGDREGFAHLAESSLGFVSGPIGLTCDVSRHIWLAFRRNANASSINLVSCNGMSLCGQHQGLVGHQIWGG